MEPNNIEKQIKEKLDCRTIQPSNQAWDRLDAMLTVSENKKPKRNYNWFYVAASFLGFILMATIFFNQIEGISDVERNDVVIENKAIENASETSIVEKGSVIKPLQPIAENSVAHSGSKKIELKSKTARSLEKENTYALSSNQIPKEHAIINQKTEQKISLPKSNDANVDQLLATVSQAAENEIVNKKSIIKVNAGKLLSQVDGELELSFREKVIKTAGKNFRTVKESLASRNQEEQSY